MPHVNIKQTDLRLTEMTHVAITAARDARTPLEMQKANKFTDALSLDSVISIEIINSLVPLSSRGPRVFGSAATRRAGVVPAPQQLTSELEDIDIRSQIRAVFKAT